MTTLGPVLPFFPTVFISSTVKDFRDLRLAIKHVLESQGYRVLLSEQPDFMVRGDRTAIEECLTNVRASDYCILIIGGRRGGLLEDENVSVTRKEFRTALSQFLATGKPRIIPYLRADVEIALTGGSDEQERAGIDDPDHLASFIEEVENPEMENVENFLTRFNEFPDLMMSLSSRLSIGKNVWETLIRRSLLSELTGNLAIISTRRGSGAYISHTLMDALPGQIKLTPDNSAGTTTLSAGQRIRLALAMPGRIRGAALKTAVVEEAINRGFFLDYDPEVATYVPTEIHSELQNVLEDIADVRRLQDPPNSTDWSSTLILALTGDSASRKSWVVPNHELALAFAYHNGMSNVFNSHLALCKLLMGKVETLPPYERKPVTPYGSIEETRIRAERVSAMEIERLIENDLAPFGTRQMPIDFGSDKDAQLRTMIARLHSLIPSLSEKDLRVAAEAWLDTLASPDEGLEDLGSDEGR